MTADAFTEPQVPHRRGYSAQAPRLVARRRADVTAVLDNLELAWIATTGPAGPHLVPLGCAWNGTALMMATHRGNRTVRNLAHCARTRITPGNATDVVILDGTTEVVDPVRVPPADRSTVARLPMNPQRAGDVVYLFFVPDRILAWRHRGEIAGRTVMAHGRWLD